MRPDLQLVRGAGARDLVDDSRGRERLFWRLRAHNPVNELYFAQADGCLKGECRHVFWYGVGAFDHAGAAVAHCRERAATLMQ